MEFIFTGSNSEVKLKMVLPGVPLDQCNNLFQPEGFTIEPIQICVGGEEGKDSCRGTTASHSE